MTASQRHIRIDETLFNELALLARKRRRSLTRVTVELLRRALTLEEDSHFSRVADERLAEGRRRIRSRRAWK